DAALGRAAGATRASVRGDRRKWLRRRRERGNGHSRATRPGGAARMRHPLRAAAVRRHAARADSRELGAVRRRRDAGLPVIELGVRELLARFADRSLSPVESVEALASRIEAVEPLLRAFVTTTLDT